ncbi:hypothetical protein JOM49_003329 [Amycolatopsis magusensis]|uniref:Uncharacterized protein n=1 Tax=Amycolatopsis magusensis TaxID=882444 RepID=A0ABS4PQT9_9PSEU|nr:hypothetical protein [Amycolatopsis magusensis]
MTETLALAALAPDEEDLGADAPISVLSVAYCEDAFFG